MSDNTLPAVKEKWVLICPAAMVTLVGILTIDGLLLVRSSLAPPSGAGPLKEAVMDSVVPADKLEEFAVSKLKIAPAAVPPAVPVLEPPVPVLLVDDAGDPEKLAFFVVLPQPASSAAMVIMQTVGSTEK